MKSQSGLFIVLSLAFFHVFLHQPRFYQGYRRSRGHKARGQGQGHKKIRSQGQGQPFRGQTLSRPRTGMLEAKAQGHKRFIGVVRIFDWGGLNHKSHAMTSSKICLLAHDQDFAKGEGLN